MKRTIQDVKIGDVVISKFNREFEVIDVGEHGFVTKRGNYFAWEEAKLLHFTIKQPEQDIEIADELVCIGKNVLDLAIIENRNLIIELQKEVNKLKERVK